MKFYSQAEILKYMKEIAEYYQKESEKYGDKLGSMLRTGPGESGAKEEKKQDKGDKKGDQKKPSFLAVNPMGKVPAIFHRGVVVTECAAICAYLADAFPEGKLAPPTDSPSRGSYYRWLFFGACCVEAAVIDRMLQRPLPERPGAIGYGTYEATMDTLEKAIAGPYILGAQFSSVDVYLGSTLGFGMMMKAVEPRPAFVEYTKRIEARPAWQRMMQQGEKITAQMKKAS